MQGQRNLTPVLYVVAVCTNWMVEKAEYAVEAFQPEYYGVDYQLFLARRNKRPTKRQTRPPNNRLTYDDEKAIIQFMDRLKYLI
jgi:hypothetical protein